MKTTDRLHLPSPLNNWLEDETFFSFLVRQKIFWGTSLDTDYISFISKNPHLVNIIYPRNLIDIDCELTTPQFLQSIKHRTILPFFAPFQLPSKIRCCLFYIFNAAQLESKKRLKHIAGNLYKSLTLKSCTECITEDESRYGTSYWHLAHQYPLATYCLKHRYPLQTLIAATNTGREPLNLPNKLGFLLQALP